MILMRIAQTIMLAWGWRRAVIAFMAGGVSTLALAPFDIWPVMFLTFPVLVWLIDGASGGRWSGLAIAAVTGWWFGFGYFLAGLYWVGNAFLVDARIFGWLLPFAVLALPAGLAVFTSLGVMLARLLWTRGPIRIPVLAAALTAVEWLRGNAFTGFPWNAFGYTLTGPLALAQSASLIGLWGLTIIAVAVFASPAVLADDRTDTSRPWLAPACALFMLAAMAAYGNIRLAGTPTEFVEGVRLRIMQPNMRQDEKFNYSAKQAIISRYLALSDRSTGAPSPSMGGATHLIWPESAFPFFLTREPDALAEIAKFLPEGAVLITGGARLAEAASTPQSLRAYNSLYVIDHHGSILSVYDKMHLTPFGEYLPFQDFLERLGLMQLTKIKGGFLAGERRRTIHAPRAPGFIPLICYEIIFPHEAVPGEERPDWLVNLTNDGWFGISAGPYQHFQQARVRTIEEGLPLVRAANTGISAVVDPLGRVIKYLPLGIEGVLDSPLPQRTSETIYRRLGNGPIGLVIGGILIAGIIRRTRQS
jgi:apolipoprotein N-acyltransferase